MNSNKFYQHHLGKCLVLFEVISVIEDFLSSNCLTICKHHGSFSGRNDSLS